MTDDLDLNALPDWRDAVTAIADLIGRSGAKGFDIGYHDEEPEPGALNWYAQAMFKGARLFAEGATPAQAADRLGRKILKGARCRRCGKAVHVDRGEGCVWRRVGRLWIPGCGREIDASIPLKSYQQGR